MTKSISQSMITERKTFPEFPDDVYGQMRKNDLKRVTKEIFKLFCSITRLIGALALLYFIIR